MGVDLGLKSYIMPDRDGLYTPESIANGVAAFSFAQGSNGSAMTGSLMSTAYNTVNVTDRSDTSFGAFSAPAGTNTQDLVGAGPATTIGQNRPEPPENNFINFSWGNGNVSYFA